MIDHRLVAAAVALAALIAMPAAAQTAPSGPATSAATASTLAGKWNCVSRAAVEIAPVSFDTYGETNAWVMVHRVNGEIIASERISQREVELLRHLPCSSRDSKEDGVTLVG